MHAKIGAVIFDLDGVLVDSEALINGAAVAMFKEQGLTVAPEDFLPFVGAGEERYVGGVADLYNFPLDVVLAKQRTYEIYLDLVPSHLRAFPGVHDLLQTCRKAGLRLAVATSTDHVKAVASLQKVGLPLEFWDTVVMGEQVERKKPAPDIFLTTAAKLGLEPADCVVVEDAIHGIQAAKAAGMRCIAVAHTFSAVHLREADLIREKISYVRLSDIDPKIIFGEAIQ